MTELILDQCQRHLSQIMSFPLMPVSVSSVFVLRIFSRTHVNGSESVHTARGCSPAVRSRSGAAAAVQLSFTHRVYFCCAATTELKWQHFVHSTN